MKPLSPCKDCKERAVGCHSECEQFARYREALGSYKKTMKNNLRKKDVYEGYQKEKKEKFCNEKF